MRLICPNCDAQYEVPDDVIPPEGRDVQCSSCGNTWFQAPAEDPQDATATDVERDPEWVTAESAPNDLTPDNEGADDAPVAESDPSHEVNTPEEEPLVEPEKDVIEDEPSLEHGRIVSMAADASEEALAAAVKEAVRRTLPDQNAKPDETPELEKELNTWLDNDVSHEDTLEDDDLIEPEVVDVETVEEHHPERARRELDPAVTEVLREEAQLEAERRAAESTLIETQTDLGLEEPLDDSARRVKQSRERMARLRGKSIEEVDNPPPPPPSNSRRDLLPDIEEINSTLRSTEDRQPEELPDGRPTLAQRRSGGSRIGFALAILVIAVGAYVYSKPDAVSASVPAAQPYVSAYVGTVDKGRLALDQQMTRLMLWLDGMTAASSETAGETETN